MDLDTIHRSDITTVRPNKIWSWPCTIERAWLAHTIWAQTCARVTAGPIWTRIFYANVFSPTLAWMHATTDHLYLYNRRSGEHEEAMTCDDAITGDAQKLSRILVYFLSRHRYRIKLIYN